MTNLLRGSLYVLFALKLACLSPLYSQNPSSKRIFSKDHGYSVVLPKRWYVYNGGDLPLFFNYRAEDALPQGQLPPGGAEIHLLLPAEWRQDNSVHSMSSWVAQEVRMHNGSHVKRNLIRGPAMSGRKRALQVSFDQLALGTPGQSLRLVAVFWQVKDRPFAAELSYVEGDSKGRQYQTVLLEMVRSFKLERK